MLLSDEQKEILSDYTDDLSEVTTMEYSRYVRASGKTVSKLLDEFHVIWFHTDPGNMYLVPKKEPGGSF